MEILNKQQLKQSTLHQQRDMGDLSQCTGLEYNPDALFRQPAPLAKDTIVMVYSAANLM